MTNICMWKETHFQIKGRSVLVAACIARLKAIRKQGPFLLSYYTENTVFGPIKK